MKLKKYQKKYDYSYTLGVFPTLELFKKYPNQVKQVLLHFEGDKNKGIKEIKDLCKKHHVSCDYSPKAIKRVAVKENTYVVGVFEKYESTLDKDKNHVVLVNPSNVGNVGTIIRTMVGFGQKNLAVIRPSVDIFDPKVIRSSMGSVFYLNFEYFSEFKEYLNKYHSHKIYTFRINADNSLRDIDFGTPHSLVFGKESSGLSAEFNNIGTGVKINHEKDIDSLNLSISVGIALYESVK